MIDLLVLVKTFVEIRLASTTGPQDVPLVRLSVRKVVCLEHRPHQLGVSSEDFVQQLTRVLIVVSASIAK